MSKITRKKLTKGTKLQAQPINDFYQSVARAIGDGTLNKDNMAYETPFELEWSIDSINWTDDTATQQQAWTFPFILAATQDIFSTQLTEESIAYTLRQLVVSMDQGDEPIVWFPKQTRIAPGVGVELLGTSEGDAGNFDFKINIYKKTPTNVENNITTWETEMVSYDIPGAAFALANQGTNPYVIKGINQKFTSDSAYCMSVQFIGQTPSADGAGSRNLSIKNLQISLKFTTPIRQRDSQGSSDEDPTGMSNNPTLYGTGQDSFDPINLGTINPGDTIQEDPLQTNIEELDKKLQRKLSGGFSSTWSKPAFYEQLDAQAYHAFTVPLFNNNIVYDDEGLCMPKMPYTEATITMDLPIVPDGFPGAVPLQYVYDRRVIPITEPFEIHHIFLCYEGRGATGPGRSIDSHKFGKLAALGSVGTMQLEVFLGSGWNSDWYGTESIAYWDEANWNSTNVVDEAVDPLTQSIFQNVGQTRTRIIQIPLNYEGPATNSFGQGYFRNGIPTFVGRGVGFNSNSRTDHVVTRGNPPTAPNTKGQEKFIHIVMGWYGLPYTNEISNHKAEDLLAPGGAHLIFIGKKSLVKSEW
jgi:hypothetical protein